MIPIGDSPSVRKPSFITPLLVVANICVYLFMILRGPSLSFYVLRWGVVPSQISKAFSALPIVSPVFFTVLTSMFVHGGLLHLLGNLFFLWVFGDNIEDRLGKLLFVLFYLLGGIFAFLLQYLQDTNLRVPMVGASGAISAVLGAYIYLYPGASVMTLIPIFYFPIVINIPAIYFLLFWIGNQLLNVARGTAGVGWLAHIGGFVFGLLFAVIFIRKEKTYLR